MQRSMNLYGLTYDELYDILQKLPRAELIKLLKEVGISIKRLKHDCAMALNDSDDFVDNYELVFEIKKRHLKIKLTKQQKELLFGLQEDEPISTEGELKLYDNELRIAKSLEKKGLIKIIDNTTVRFTTLGFDYLHQLD